MGTSAKSAAATPPHRGPSSRSAMARNSASVASAARMTGIRSAVSDTPKTWNGSVTRTDTVGGRWE